MNATPLISRLKSRYLILAIMGLLLALAVGKDLLHSYIKSYPFYLSESVLFETFWLIFVPVIYWIAKPASRKLGPAVYAIFTIVLIIIHIAVFSALVFVVSALWFDHPFGFTSIFVKYIVENSLLCLFVYTLIGLLFYGRSPDILNEKDTISKILVTHQNHKFLLNIEDIVYVKSATPYIMLVTENRSFLYNGTLKTFLSEKAPTHFLRIHKSIIVNTHCVKCYKSRKNGDYDVKLTNSQELRVSRNYSKGFKSFFR